jgi:hypothetical protein
MRSCQAFELRSERTRALYLIGTSAESRGANAPRAAQMAVQVPCVAVALGLWRRALPRAPHSASHGAKTAISRD